MIDTEIVVPLLCTSISHIDNREALIISNELTANDTEFIQYYECKMCVSYCFISSAMRTYLA